LTEGFFTKFATPPHKIKTNEKDIALMRSISGVSRLVAGEVHLAGKHGGQWNDDSKETITAS